MKIKICEHNRGIYSRSNIWFCSGCEQIVPAPEIPESVRQSCDDWSTLSYQEYCKKYNLPWDGTEFARTKRGFWDTIKNIFK